MTLLAAAAMTSQSATVSWQLLAKLAEAHSDAVLICVRQSYWNKDANHVERRSEAVCLHFDSQLHNECLAKLCRV